MTKTYQAVIMKIFKGLGYCSILLQWFFLATIYLSIFSEYDWFNDLFESPTNTPSPADDLPTVAIEPTVGSLIAVVVTVALLAAFIYALRHLPGSIVRGGDTLTRKPAELLVPELLKHISKRPTEKRRLVLTARLALAMKGILVVLPVLLLLPVDRLGWPMDSSAAWAVGAFLASASIIWFGLEIVFTKVFKAGQ